MSGTRKLLFEWTVFGYRIRLWWHWRPPVDVHKFKRGGIIR